MLSRRDRLGGKDGRHGSASDHKAKDTSSNLGSGKKDKSDAQRCVGIFKHLLKYARVCRVDD